MDLPSGNADKNKGLSAHQSGLVAPHSKLHYDPDAQGKPREGLTVREEQILALVALNRSDQEISNATGIKVKTVKKHLENIYPKIKANTRASAAIWFLRRQLEARDREILVLKQILAESGGSSAASST